MELSNLQKNGSIVPTKFFSLAFLTSDWNLQGSAKAEEVETVKHIEG